LTEGFDASSHTRRWLLVVDDDAALREVVGEILEDAGWSVVLARSGTDALRVLRERSAPAAILLDLMMSDGDGFSFRREQRADPALSAIPIIVMTASGRPEARIFAMEAAGHVNKPFEVEDLLAIVARVAAGSPARQKT